MASSPIAPWRALPLGLLLAALPLGVFTAHAATALDEVVKLPEFRVASERPLPPREEWKYVKVANFEVLSSVSDRLTKQFVKDLREFQIVLGAVAPHMLIRAEQPVMVILCGKSGQFEKIAEGAKNRSQRGRAAALVRDGEIASIVIDYQAHGFAEEFTLWSGFNVLARQEVHTTSEFIRQYIHLALSRVTPRVPAWMAEGMANVYADIDYNNKWIEVGKPNSFRTEYTVTSSSGFGGYSSYASTFGYSSLDNYGGFGAGFGNYGYAGTPQPFVMERVMYYPMTIMPFEKMFAVDYDSPTFRSGGSSDSLSHWRKQATAFLHMCLYGRNGKYQKAYIEFARRAVKEPVTEALFIECFGRNYKQMALELRSYTEFTDYRGTVYKPVNKKESILGPAPAVTVRPATDGEIGRIKGETLRLGGQDEAARMEFVHAYLRGNRDPELLGSLGLMARQRRDDARARTYLEAVAEAPAPIPRPRAYLELARLRHAQILAANGGRPLDATELASVFTPLFAAHALPQQLAENYLEIAKLWKHTTFTPSRSHLAVLEKGMLLFPRHGPLAVATADLLIAYGYKADAATIIQQTLDATSDPILKSQLEDLRRRIASPETRPPESE